MKGSNEMRYEYKIVGGMSLLGGVLTSGVIYAGGLFMPQPTPPVVPTATLPNPAVSTTLPPPTVTPEPTATATEVPKLRARLSHYWPKWGGPNCHSANWDGEACNAVLTDGKQWQHWSYWANVGTACPREFERGTVFRIPEFGDYICIDRGGAINMLPDGTFFLDLLTSTQPYIPDGEVIRDKYSPGGAYVVEVEVLE